ncbi:MAG TPA: fumarylacetoacetate hydrolase family protein [Polyangia bacterium]|jgi:2-keto-4-pentenoate hydratase/2-oxohepta-3-ene-1,7-dioic acid hydratase in catechol pathway
MRICRVETDGGPRWGVVLDDRIELMAGDPFTGPASSGEWRPRAGARLLAPATPSKILAVGQNYRAHAAEMGKGIPDEPLLFLKPPSALLAPGAPIVRPAGYERVDHEGELCLVIGRRARHVRREEALDYLLGYTILNDVTVRDLQKKDVQFTRAKGFDSFAPVGPWIETDLDPGRLRLQTRVNGELRQDGQTDDLIFPVAELIAFASRVMTLEPGDLFSTGTPKGVGQIYPGDVVSITIDGIGTLENPVIGES